MAVSSPLFQYTPCKSCDSASLSLDNSTSPSASTWTTTSTNASIALSFTGTSLSFDLDLPSTAACSILVNGSPAPTTANTTNTSVSNLQYGSHSFELSIQQTGNESVRFRGVNGGLGSLVTAQSVNTTVDDTAWRDWKVTLTPTWNMLEQGESNWVNAVRVQAHFTPLHTCLVGIVAYLTSDRIRRRAQNGQQQLQQLYIMDRSYQCLDDDHIQRKRNMGIRHNRRRCWVSKGHVRLFTDSALMRPSDRTRSCLMGSHEAPSMHPEDQRCINRCCTTRQV